MADCPSLKKCIFFNDKMAQMPGMTSLLKKRYCEGDNSGCARWIVRTALGPLNVPDDLFPNQIDKANVLIAK